MLHTLVKQSSDISAAFGTQWKSSVKINLILYFRVKVEYVNQLPLSS